MMVVVGRAHAEPKASLVGVRVHGAGALAEDGDALGGALGDPSSSQSGTTHACRPDPSVKLAEPWHTAITFP